MKINLFCFVTMLSLAIAYGQGTFIYDQQSSDESGILEGTAGLGQQPLGQSFSPTLSSIEFIRLYLFDGVAGGGGGATISINLRSDSITGTILASTTGVDLPNLYSGFTTFFFSTPVALDAATTYYFQPIVQSGGGFGTAVGNYNYSGGTAFINGASDSSRDFWFREGIVVPEPSSVGLFLLGGGLLVRYQQKRKRR